MRRAAAGLVLLLAGAAAAAPPAGPAADEGPPLVLPVSIDMLWLRSGGDRRSGDLIVGESGLEFTARKRAFAIPLDRIHVVSYGKMSGDVDTDWVVLAVGVAPPYDLMGLRDGKKWGYGNRTREIYHQLRGILKQLAAAQFRVPPGHVPYENPERTCSWAIPESWSSYAESLVLIGGQPSSGTTILSARPVRQVETSADGAARTVDDLELLDAILAGESPGFFVERDVAGRGMRCEALSSAAHERVLERARKDLAFGEAYEVLQPPAAAPASVGGCDALHVVGRSRRPDGAELIFELYAVAARDTLYLFGLRALADRHAEHRGPYATAVETARFGVALPE